MPIDPFDVLFPWLAWQDDIVIAGLLLKMLHKYGSEVGDTYKKPIEIIKEIRANRKHRHQFIPRQNRFCGCLEYVFDVFLNEKILLSYTQDVNKWMEMEDSGEQNTSYHKRNHLSSSKIAPYHTYPHLSSFFLYKFLGKISNNRNVIYINIYTICQNVYTFWDNFISIVIPYQDNVFVFILGVFVIMGDSDLYRFANP